MSGDSQDRFTEMVRALADRSAKDIYAVFESFERHCIKKERERIVAKIRLFARHTAGERGSVASEIANRIEAGQ